MFLKQKKYLRKIIRTRISEIRDLHNGLRLDRNEKVDNWPKNFIRNVLASKPPAFFSAYPNLAPLYNKLARHLDVSEEQILIASGIDGVIKTLFEILVRPGDKVGVFSPTYAMYHVYANLFQAELVHINYQEDYAPNWSLFESFLMQNPIALFLPNPNQPIESCFSLDELRSIAKRCLDANCLLVVDEAYHYFGADSSLPLLKEFENVVVMRTFSKAFGIPSARLGYMASTPDNMELLSKTRLAHEANAISAAMAEYLLDHFDIVQHYTQEINESRFYVKKTLEAMGILATGDKGNYLLIVLDSNEAIKNCIAFLKEKKIYVKGPWPAPWDMCMTISLGPRKTMVPFIAAMSEFVRGK